MYGDDCRGGYHSNLLGRTDASAQWRCAHLSGGTEQYQFRASGGAQLWLWLMLWLTWITDLSNDGSVILPSND